MDINKEWKETTKILDKIVPFTQDDKAQILTKIETSKLSPLPNKRPFFRHTLGASIAAALLCLTIGVGFTPLAAPLTEPIIKLFSKGEQVSQVKTHQPISEKINTDLNIEEEITKIKNSMKAGEVKQVYVRENNAGVARGNGQPYNLNTVIAKPLFISNWDSMVKEIEDKTIQEYVTLAFRKDQSDWRKGKDIKLPLQSVSDFTFKEGGINYLANAFDSEKLVEEAVQTGKNIIIKDLTFTDEITSISLKYQNDNSSFHLNLNFGQGWDTTELPGLENAKEFSKVKFGNNEAAFVEDGTTKQLIWVDKVNEKITNYMLSSEELTKEELENVLKNLF
jgi:hypothetical protein